MSNKIRAGAGRTRAGLSRAARLTAFTMVASLVASAAGQSVAVANTPGAGSSVLSAQSAIAAAKVLSGIRFAKTAEGDVNIEAAAQVREDRCRLGRVLHLGGPAMKATAQGGLTGSEAELHRVADPQYWSHTPLDVAFEQDKAAAAAKTDELYQRHYAWSDPVNGLPNPGFHYYSDFVDAPNYAADLGSYYGNRIFQSEGDFYEDLAPKAGQASVDAAKQLAATLYAQETYENYRDKQAWDDLVWNKFRADDVRLFLQYGGFPKVAPAPDSVEFRMDVEALKARFASCASSNSLDPYNVLGAEVTAAATEWKTEVDGQAAPRAVIVAAEVKAAAELAKASQAMAEAVGQSWTAGQLVYWQTYWLQAPKEPLRYPEPKDFERAKKGIADAQAAAKVQVDIANKAAAAAKKEADKVPAAQSQAQAIADAARVPRGRGLMYAQQSAQVAKAAAAAAQAAAKATLTASNATKASAADSKTQIALAQTQAHAAQAEFRRAAAEEAAAQAKVAAEGAAAQAAQAAQAATKAKAAQATAEAAEKTARDAAADAHRKRTTAEQERANAADARRRAEAERVKAAEAEARAQAQQANAAKARRDAESAGDTALTKMLGAEQAENRARVARDEAVAAEKRRDSIGARARALEAAAAAAAGTADANEARTAANEAKAAATEATGAASAARAAANQASDAAVAARAAATEATGAADRARAAADGAGADAATTRAAVATAHVAAAEAIKASEDAAQNVKNAEAFAKAAAAAAVKARQDATAAQHEANFAAADSIRTAGFAYATAQAAFAARDSAAAVIAPANQAIELGSPFKNSDSSAGLAVLTGQNAKTAAEQQAAAAQARADEAAKAAVAAKTAAARAAADAKAAANAAARAADEAAKAAQSLAQAGASAAEAATAAVAAKKAEANTVEYDRQANEDALMAGRAASDAEGDAAAARGAATDAEKDAGAARSAATTAEKDASAARDVAAQADQYATAAEQDAASAQAYAREADQAAIRAEEQQRAEDQTRRSENVAADRGVGGGGVGLTAEEERLLLAECGQSCVDEYRKALADAGKTVMQWIKENGVEVLLDVIGYTDLKNCFMTGDVEACLWTLVNVASLVVAVGKLPAVSKAIVRVGSGVTKFLEEASVAKRTLDRLRQVIEKAKKVPTPPCRVGAVSNTIPKAARGGPARSVHANAIPCIKALIDEGKFDYFFGKVKSGEHNTNRSRQNVAQLARIGVFDNPEGRAMLRGHLEEVVKSNDNIARAFTDDYGTSQIRDSLFAGPQGVLKLESTWQITDDGLRLTSIIPFGAKG